MESTQRPANLGDVTVGPVDVVHIGVNIVLIKKQDIREKLLSKIACRAVMRSASDMVEGQQFVSL